jgi:hypothetical protein
MLMVCSILILFLISYPFDKFEVDYGLGGGNGARADTSYWVRLKGADEE